MPELAEVEYYRNQWNTGLGKKVETILIHPQARIFRDCGTKALVQTIPSTTLENSQAHGKQMLFQFSNNIWVGLHLGMTGKLATSTPDHKPEKHEHFVLLQHHQSLIFSDYRMFGKILYFQGKSPPPWWKNLPPDLLSDEFDLTKLGDFLIRRKKSPIKNVLLSQDRFPGIGNWMADEILWRAHIHPLRLAGDIDEKNLTILHEKIKEVCQDAMEVIAPNWGTPPNDWLFNHRWKDGALCPITKSSLNRQKIGGRTTCWSPKLQKL